MPPDLANPGVPARRVSFILHKFSRGGSDRVAAHLARGFADRGMDVDLIVFVRGGEVETILTDLVGADISINYLGRAWGPRPLELIRGLPALVRMLRARAPDTIISTANNTAWISAAALRLSELRDCRLFLKTTNPIARSRHRGLVKRVRAWGYARVFAMADGVWPLSPDETRELREDFPKTAGLFADVVNPYVTNDMLGARPTGTTRAAGKLVVGVGRLTAQKGFDRLIDAFALVADKAARLEILGEGEDREVLTARIRDLGLEDRVSLPGYVTDVAAALHRADLFVLTSHYEGLPAVLLEAMAADCPILSTDCFPAARSMLADTPGCRIIERADPASLARMIDEALSMRRPAGLREIAERYSVANGVASHVAALS